MNQVKNEDWVEGDLYFDFSKAIQVTNFDRSGMGHHLSVYKLKAVDFILEDKETYYFIEVKDPNNPKIPLAHQEKNKEEFLKDNLSKKLLKKFEDSLFFQSMDTGIPNKKFLYIILLCLNNIDVTVHFPTLKDELIATNPILIGGKKGWKKGFDIIFLNLELWNKYFPKYPVVRLSD